MNRLAIVWLAATLAAGSGSALADGCKSACGMVLTVDRQQQEGSGSGLGAVAGGVLGGVLGHQIGSGRGNTLATVGGAAGGAYVGHQVEKKAKTKTVFVVTVKMDDGGERRFTFSSEPAYAPGDRVQLVDSKLKRYTGG